MDGGGDVIDWSTCTQGTKWQTSGAAGKCVPGVVCSAYGHATHGDRRRRGWHKWQERRMGKRHSIPGSDCGLRSCSSSTTSCSGLTTSCRAVVARSRTSNSHNHANHPRERHTTSDTISHLTMSLVVNLGSSHGAASQTTSW